jgi:hypothetical protein
MRDRRNVPRQDRLLSSVVGFTHGVLFVCPRPSHRCELGIDILPRSEGQIHIAALAAATPRGYQRHTCSDNICVSRRSGQDEQVPYCASALSRRGPLPASATGDKFPRILLNGVGWPRQLRQGSSTDSDGYFAIAESRRAMPTVQFRSA